MTDRELLEVAAKAAGIRYDGYDDDAGCDIWFVPELGRYTQWNPLADDGDALRLAVKLGIEVWNFHQYGRALATHARGMNEFWVLGDDPYAATRRAITRAAAALAKGA